jgi:hypothetical protein
MLYYNNVDMGIWVIYFEFKDELAGTIKSQSNKKKK